jgi:hypothetical protein
MAWASSSYQEGNSLFTLTHRLFPLISIDVRQFTFSNIYAPSGTIAIQKRKSFLRKTLPSYAITTNLPLVIVDDFNSIDDPLDRSMSKTSPSKTKDLALLEIIYGLEHVGMWKKLKPKYLNILFTTHKVLAELIEYTLVELMLSTKYSTSKSFH